MSDRRVGGLAPPDWMCSRWATIRPDIEFIRREVIHLQHFERRCVNAILTSNTSRPLFQTVATVRYDVGKGLRVFCP